MVVDCVNYIKSNLLIDFCSKRSFSVNMEENGVWEECIENQLSHMEECVYGDLDKSKSYIKCTETLTKFNNRLNLMTAGREKIAGVLKKLDDIEKYLNTDYCESLSLPDTAKIQLILAEDRNIKKVHQELQQIEDLKDVLNSEHIKSAPGLNDRLLQLSQIQIQQEEESEKLTEDVLALFNSYNAVINTLTKQFIYWDDLLTKEEVKSQMKK